MIWILVCNLFLDLSCQISLVLKFDNSNEAIDFVHMGLKHILAKANKTGHQTWNGLKNENKAP